MNRKAKKNEVANVRVVDQYSGTDGARVDRIISQLQNSHSQIRLLCTDSFAINSSTVDVNGNLAGSQIRLFDEFTTISTQFETFRIAAVRYDVYDINPSNVVTGAFSTFHDVATTGNQLAFTFPSVIDGPDSQIVPPGTGKISFTWVAHGTAENQFLSDDSNAAQQLDFGGLRYSILAASTAIKYRIVVKAVVDFRGRL